MEESDLETKTKIRLTFYTINILLKTVPGLWSVDSIPFAVRRTSTR
jgi:hypothetical protein